MKQFLLLLVISTALVIQAAEESSGDALARLGEMRILFKGFDEVKNPVTGLSETVFFISFVDLPIPGGPLLLRGGDRVAGYTIGRFIKREPVILPNDGVKQGTLPTLEVIHVESGEKYIFEPGQLHRVRRDPIRRQ